MASTYTGPRVELAAPQTFRAAHDGRLRASVAAFLITHAIGLLTMLILILPGISPHVPIVARAAYVHEHATAWRLGWLAWQASALSDVWLTVELARRARAMGTPAAQRWMMAALVFLVLALVPDQYAEARLVGAFTRAMPLEVWRTELRLYMRMTGTWGCLGYTAMTLCWLQAVPLLRGSRRIAVWSQASMALAFAGAAIASYVAWRAPDGGAAAFDVATVLNGYAFLALLANVALAVRWHETWRAPARGDER